MEIADRLNEEGFRPPKRRGGFSKEMVRQLVHRLGSGDEHRGEGTPRPPEWWLSALADALGMPQGRLREWVRRGWLFARKTPEGRWVAWADDVELIRLRRLLAHPCDGDTRYPPELTTPRRGDSD